MSSIPIRPSRVEIDLDQLRRNFDLILSDAPPGVALTSVVKDEAYGHGALAVARVALAAGAKFLGLSTLDEAVALRDAGIAAPILLLSPCPPEELPACLDYQLTCCVTDLETAKRLDALSRERNITAPIHLKINTGMSRYGFRWDRAVESITAISRLKCLKLEGILSHFSMSDELDKTFALLQLSRFNELLAQLSSSGIEIPFKHHCNSGGLLDLPVAHFNLVRVGILPLGVYPSSVCRRLPGLQPVMSVKTRIAHIQQLQPGDKVGYGMRYTAPDARRIAVLPIGYGDGFPRVRNEGYVLIHGQRAPLVGGVAMDAVMVDVTHIPEARPWDDVVVMGKQGNEQLTAHDVAALKKSVSYDVLVNWRWRLPRVYFENGVAASTAKCAVVTRRIG